MQLFIIKFFLGFFDFFNQKKIYRFLSLKLGKKIDFVLDVGCHRGETIKILNSTFNVNKIYGFEPSKENFSFLQKIEKKNDNIELFNFACGEFNETKKLKFSIESSSSTINEINYESKYYKIKKLLLLGLKKKDMFIDEQILVKRLDEFLIKEDIANIDLLKIDTEGYEFNVLKGASGVLKKINLIYFEHHYDDMIKKNYNFSEIHDYLTKNNFVKLFKSKMPFRRTFDYIYQNKDFL